MVWRDISRATDERTLIAGLVPTVATGHKLLLMLVDQSGPLCTALFGSLNSFVFHDAANRGAPAINVFA
jgi:hypothetical protein